MAQGYVKVNGPATPYRLYYRGSPFAIVEAVDALVLTWNDGTTEDVPALTRAVLQSDGHTTMMDSSVKVWLVVAVKGSPLVPVLIAEQDYATIDALLTGSTWAVVYRVTQTLEYWQQA